MGGSRSAKSTVSILVKLVSLAGTGTFYVTRKNPRRVINKIELRPPKCLPSRVSQLLASSLHQMRARSSGALVARKIMDTPPWWLPHVAMACCQVAYSLMQVISEAAVEHIPPFPFAALRTTSALPFIWAMARYAEPGPIVFPPKIMAATALLGVFGVFLPQGLIFVGVHMAGPDMVAITQPAIPVYVAILSAALGFEKLRAGHAAGITLAVGGALLVLDVSKLNVHSTQTVGVIVMLFQSLSCAVYYTALSRVLVAQPQPLQVFAWASLFGAGCLIAVAAPQAARVDWRGVPDGAWGVLAYCSVVVSFVAHSTMSWAVRCCAATVPSLYTCLQPVLTSLFAALLLAEWLRWKDVGGMVLILAGLLVTVWSKHRERQGRRMVAIKSNPQLLEVELEDIEAGGGGVSWIGVNDDQEPLNRHYVYSDDDSPFGRACGSGAVGDADAAALLHRDPSASVREMSRASECAGIRSSDMGDCDSESSSAVAGKGSVHGGGRGYGALLVRKSLSTHMPLSHEADTQI